MRYMLFLHNSSYQPKDNLWLKNKARMLSSASGITIRDTRVSRSYIEYDISTPDDSKIVEVASMFLSGYRKKKGKGTSYIRGDEIL
jgi:hypothetical protein